MTRRHTFPDGRTLTELNAATGTFRVEDMSGNVKGYLHEQRVEILPSLDEQQRASAATVPRLRVVPT